MRPGRAQLVRLQRQAQVLVLVRQRVPQRPALALYSTVTGDRVDGVLYDGIYWGDNIRNPVLFERAMAALVRWWACTPARTSASCSSSIRSISPAW